MKFLSIASIQRINCNGFERWGRMELDGKAQILMHWLLKVL